MATLVNSSRPFECAADAEMIDASQLGASNSVQLKMPPKPTLK